MFNGNAAVDESYETFHISRLVKKPVWLSEFGEDLKNKYKGFRFCKTNRKPYDSSVVACLIFIHNIDKNNMKIRSDGKLTDWHEGLDLCKAIYPHKDFIIPEIDSL